MTGITRRRGLAVFEVDNRNWRAMTIFPPNEKSQRRIDLALERQRVGVLACRRK